MIATAWWPLRASPRRCLRTALGTTFATAGRWKPALRAQSGSSRATEFAGVGLMKPSSSMSMARLQRSSQDALCFTTTSSPIPKRSQSAGRTPDTVARSVLLHYGLYRQASSRQIRS
eukprot:6719924-Prymnesium_polylepis.1